MFNKKLKDLERSDIEKMIEGQISQSITLDCKVDFPSTEDERYKGKNLKRLYHEIAKDITGLANTDGGNLIYGIRDEGNIATEIVGIEPKRGNEEICDWLTSFMYNGGVTYKVIYRTHIIKILNSEKIILVIEVP